MRPLAGIAPDWQAAWNGAPLALPDGSRLTWTDGLAGASAEANGEPPALQVRYRRGGERIKLVGRGRGANWRGERLGANVGG